ncbi:MAG: glucokinase [Proteobacteria bacterium]|nr:glucokinase [Pseudomonadota bacterium]
MILAGDIGGTKTRLALYAAHSSGGDGVPLQQVALKQYRSSDAPGLAAIIKDFLSNQRGAIAAACFGIPGPVVDGMVRTPNLPWLLSERELSGELGIPRLKLVNDLVATTASVPHLGPEGLITVHPGSPKGSATTRAVLAPGTGTGQGYLCEVNGRFIPFASEGGHTNFAPTTELEDRLLVYLRAKVKGRVSVERILCGPGLVNIYEFLKYSDLAQEPEELKSRFGSTDAAAIISAAGLAGEFDICVQSLDMFAHILGSYAGDLVLTYMATGGVYLGGGVPPKIAPKLLTGTLLSGYLNKGRLTDVVKSTPLFIIKDDHAALLGARSIAAALVEQD